jgi:hypothetical protein
MVGEVADFVISFGSEGRIASQGSVAEILVSNFGLQFKTEQDQGVEKEEQVMDGLKSTYEQETQTKKSVGKLVVTEEVAEGHVGWPTLERFLLALGGVEFWVAYFSGFVLADMALLIQTYWFG